MRQLSTSEKISVWLGGTLLVLLLLTGGLYVYGWHINPDWRNEQFQRCARWQAERLAKQLSHLNGCEVITDITQNPVDAWRLQWLHLDTSAARKVDGKPAIHDLTPLRGYDLHSLDIGNADLADLSALRGMPLGSLSISGKLKNFSALKELPLQRFLLYDCDNLSDLSFLRGLPLHILGINSPQVTDLSPLTGMALEGLNISETKVADLSPLRGMQLHFILLMNTPVSDLSPLNGMPLEYLNLYGTKVTDLSPLKGMPLHVLTLANTPVANLSPIREMNITSLDFSNTPAEAVQKAAAKSATGK